MSFNCKVNFWKILTIKEIKFIVADRGCFCFCFCLYFGEVYTDRRPNLFQCHAIVLLILARYRVDAPTPPQLYVFPVGNTESASTTPRTELFCLMNLNCGNFVAISSDDTSHPALISDLSTNSFMIVSVGKKFKLQSEFSVQSIQTFVYNFE